MSVQKYRIQKGDAFTVVLNSVINLLKGNLEALGLYTYLLSLPPEWEFHKSQLRTICCVGVNKLDHLFSLLSKAELIQIVPIRNEKGQFVYFDLNVLDGTASSTMKTMPMETMPMENSTYKENNKQKKEREIKHSCASDDARPSDDQELNELSFDEFIKIYPNKKDKAKAKKRWDKIKYPERVIILAKLKEQIAKDAQYQGNPQFVPLPSTYLNGRRWEDEITVAALHPVGNATMQQRNEVKSTVGWFGGVDPARV